jgi:hypothetical protein
MHKLFLLIIISRKKVYFLISRVTLRMLEHYQKVAKALDIDVDKIILDTW